MVTNETKSEQLYETGEYLRLNTSLHKEDSAHKAQAILKLIKQFNLPHKQVCEIGCATGKILATLQLQLPETSEFTGYDIAKSHIDAGLEHQNSRLKLHVAPIEAITSHYDLALCIDVFEHIEAPYNFLRLLKDVGDYKIFNVPLDLSVQSVLRLSPILNTYTRVGHIHYYLKETALNTLVNCGYEIIHFEYLILPPHSKLMRLGHILRKLLYRVNPDWVVRILGGYSLLVVAK